MSSRTLWALLIILVAGTAVRLTLAWLRHRFPPAARLPTAPRPWTGFELFLTALPLVVFLAGLFAVFDVLIYLGGGKLRLDIALVYAGVVIMSAMGAQHFVARMRGKKFYSEYFAEGEARGGVSTAGVIAFATLISLGLVLAGAIVYLIERLG